MFHVYKAKLKRMLFNNFLSTYDKHCAALCAVTPEIACAEFQSCGIELRGLVTQEMKQLLLKCSLIRKYI